MLTYYGSNQNNAQVRDTAVCGGDPQVRHTHTHTQPFNGPLYGTTRVSQYQKGKTNLDFTEARDSE